ncbi:hypothetical protein EIKCOROL_02050 [Eikenella corrodens ATCC 23834]|uniref:Uncharacterized protein n=1 Tax=Eikenella corrodens ATCC 23834 TaxID=546274 RepID=C0DXE4_EIKCO|nr:hypothetical protein [Eikenella corrodens]EEG23328.1 hypothetical protein EIKCOROL_02050 [Eikenella corrodens ATCC 23834]
MWIIADEAGKFMVGNGKGYLKLLLGCSTDFSGSLLSQTKQAT